jgi:DNA-directed RNA polymerase I subunit RPA1
LQVREALRRMWARHGDLLSLIFATDAQRSGLALPGGGADSWRMFFLHAVAVPPNKFRPPSRMGDGL